MRAKTRLRLSIGLLVMVLAGGGIAVSVARLRGPEKSIPTGRVERGNIDPKVYVTGELRTPNTANLVAPGSIPTERHAALCPASQLKSSGWSEIFEGPGKSDGMGIVTLPVAAHSTPRAKSVWNPTQSRLGLGSPTHV